MLTSGMSSYIPNKSDSAVSENWERPLAFEGDRVCIRWQDEWKIEDYE
ncbi:MAG: hypothetical protein NC548_64915 [Lachnospiraceae bacterium]|nr:hypothetical protein [Bacteroides fragilis]MCM1225532.1 hypothetical protein [Lachnospiraceae bacterium]